MSNSNNFGRKNYTPFCPIIPGKDYTPAGECASVRGSVKTHSPSSVKKIGCVRGSRGSVKSVNIGTPPVGGGVPYYYSHFTHTLSPVAPIHAQPFTLVHAHTTRTKYPSLVIIEDTREQTPLKVWPDDVDVILPEKGLETGDYTILGWEESFTIERKSITDLAGTMIGGYEGNSQRPRKRFNNELERMQHFDCAAVIVTATPKELIEFRHHSGMDAHGALWNFGLSVFATYGIPVFPLTDEETAGRFIADLARHYVTVRTKKNRSREDKRAAAVAAWGF